MKRSRKAMAMAQGLAMGWPQQQKYMWPGVDVVAPLIEEQLRWIDKVDRTERAAKRQA